MFKKSQLFLFIIVILSIISVVLPRLFHFKATNNYVYGYPLHVDEWQHYTISMSLSDNFFNPSVFYYQDYQNFNDGSPLFHWLIYLSQKINLDLNNFYILTIFQTIFVSLIFFFFVSKLFNLKVGFFSTLIFLFIKNTVSLMGVAFFKPFILGFGLFLLTIFYIFKKQKINFWSILFFILMILVYPPFLIPFFIALFLIFKKDDKFFTKKNKILFFIAIPVSFLIGLILTKGDFSFLLNKIFIRDIWFNYSDFNLISFVDLSFIITGLLGLFNSFKQKNILIINSILLFFLFNIYFVYFTGYSLGFNYLRTIYLGLVIFSIYVAFGIDFILNFLKKNIKIFGLFLGIFFIILFFINHIFSTINFYKSGDDYKNPSINGIWLEEDKLEVLNYLKDYKNKNLKLLNPSWFGTVITPMTGFKVTAVTVSLTGGKRNYYYDLINNNCDKIKKILKSEKYNLLLLEKEKKCSFLNEKFNNGKYFIYEYIPD